MPYPERFFTFWALAAHAAHVIFPTRVPSTFPLAVTVAIGAVVHNVTINNDYNPTFDVALHHAPLAMYLAYYYTKRTMYKPTWPSLLLPPTLFVIYLTFIGGPKKLLQYYKSHTHYFHNAT